MLKPIKPFTHSSAFTVGDPHFYGFDGESFDFMGVPGKFYNLLTDKDVQINARFAPWTPPTGEDNTVMDAIGVLVSGCRIEITCETVKINGDEISDCELKLDIGRGKLVSLDQFDQLNDWVPEALKKHSAFGTFIKGSQIKTNCGYDVIVTVSTYPLYPRYLNLSIKMSGRLWPHGIIGQTADHDGVARQSCGPNGEGVIDGSCLDYEVSSLWSSDFTFSRYAGSGRQTRLFDFRRFSGLVFKAAGRLIGQSTVTGFVTESMP